VALAASASGAAEGAKPAIGVGGGRSRGPHAPGRGAAGAAESRAPRAQQGCCAPEKMAAGAAEIARLGCGSEFR